MEYIMGEKKEKKIELTGMGNRLEKIRRHFNYDRAQISKIMGISINTYSRNMMGRQLPILKSIMALHNRLGVSMEWFLFERGPMLWKEVEEKLQAEEKPQVVEKPREIKLEDLLSPGLNEMVELMKKIPLLNHSIMLHFQELKIKHKDFIREALENEPSSPVNSK
jgi:transcriptional regulator with XRE-family HTH domain